MYLPNLKYVALPVPEVIGVQATRYSKYLGSPMDTPLVWMDPVDISAKFAVCIALPMPDIIGIAVLGWGCEPPLSGRGGSSGWGMVSFEKGLVSSYRLSVVTFPLSLRVSEILPLLCSSAPLFPTTNSQLNSSLLTKDSRMAKRMQYIKANQMMKL